MKHDKLFGFRSSVFVLAIATLVGLTNSLHARNWKDKSGKFSVDAEFVKLQNGLVHLRRADGKESKVPLARLSPADQTFAREEHAKQRQAAKEKAKPKAKKIDGTLLGTLGDLKKVEADGFEIVIKRMSDSSQPVFPGLRLSKNLRYVNLQITVERNGDVPAEFSLGRLSLVSPDKNKQFGVWGHESDLGGRRELIVNKRARSKSGVGVTLIFNSKGDDRSANIWFQVPKRGADPKSYQVFLGPAPKSVFER